MSVFSLRNGELFAEDVALSQIGQQFGTPCFVYSRAALEQAFRRYDKAFGTRPHLICYAMKANSNLAVLNVLARLGTGFDIVSRGELARVLAAGGDPGKVVFSGVGKGVHEMERALGGRHRLLQRRVGGRTGGAQRGRRPTRPTCTGQSARQSGCGRQDPSVYLHRSERKQVRHSDARGARRLPRGAQTGAPAHRGRGLPHRLAAHRRSRRLPTHSSAC